MKHETEIYPCFPTPPSSDALAWWSRSSLFTESSLLPVVLLAPRFPAGRTRVRIALLVPLTDGRFMRAERTALLCQLRRREEGQWIPSPGWDEWLIKRKESLT